MFNQDIVKPENLVYKKTDVLTDKIMHYCPGCGHGTTHRIIAEVIEEMGIQDKTIGVSPVGCAVFAYNYIDIDWEQAAHGRAPALATATKRLNPDKYVFTYQGDGDLASIGTAEIIHTAARGEKICTFFVNNAVYGMTSGQMAPTTLLGQVTTTSPFGRDASYQGYPINVSELIAQLTGAVYVERVSLTDYKNVMKAKAAVKKAFEVEMSGKGFAFVEFLSTCPTNWGKEPCESLEWLKEKMIPQYPLGCFKGADLDLEVKS